MALETFLTRLKAAISHVSDRPPPTKGRRPVLTTFRPNNVEVLAFETAAIMSKLLHLWHSLSDSNLICLRNDSVSLEGVRKIVSNDEPFLLGLACAELVENLRHVAQSVSRLSSRCTSSTLRSFDEILKEFSDSGRDPHGWVLSCKDMESRNKKMDRYVTVTATLYKELEELTVLENALKKRLQPSGYDQLLHDHNKEQKLMDLQQKVQWQRQQVKHLKDRSLWNRSFDAVVSVLVRSVFTTLFRLKTVFGIGQTPPSLPRSLSSKAIVHPSENPANTSSNISSIMVPAERVVGDQDWNGAPSSFFEKSSKMLKPPETTLGGSALALHYANLIIVMEKMIKQPQLVGVDARDDLYAMLPSSIRSSLRFRLKGLGFSAADPGLAREWRAALGRILGWLSPLAQNMIKWQSERSFEQQSLVAKTNVLLLQTLFFANREKTEAAITELLVGLNYIWRFEREMTAKALFGPGSSSSQSSGR